MQKNKLRVSPLTSAKCKLSQMTVFNDNICFFVFLRMLLVVWIASSANACIGPLVTKANFPKKPTSVKKGLLLGPFSGRIVDHDTQKPIEGANVICTWAFSRGLGSPAPSATRVEKAKTDPDGRYVIQALRDLPSGLSSTLTLFTFTVVKDGYTTYKQDRRFGSTDYHYEFSQTDNDVSLIRWSPEYSIAKHLIYTGGTPQIRTSALLALAAQELDRKYGSTTTSEENIQQDTTIDDSEPSSNPTTQPGSMPTPSSNATSRPALSAKQILSVDDIRLVTKYSGQFSETPLASRGDTTDTWHFRASDKPERYDVAIRLWHLENEQLTKRYEALKQSLKGSTETNDISQRSFFIAQGEILGLGFMSKAHSSLVLLTCGQSQCKNKETLTALAKRAAVNLSRLPRSKEVRK